MTETAETTRELILMHYTSEPLEFDPSRTYEQEAPSTFGKPHGFWVSVVGEDDWATFVTDNMDSVRLNHTQRVTLAAEANILRINSAYELDVFAKHNAVETNYERRYARPWNKWPIDRRAVAEKYDGIIIAPYQWSRRMNLDWYYTWDCASGCIWNLSAIASVESAVVSA